MRWPEALLGFSLVAAGVLHLLPLAGLLSAARLEALYGIPVREPSLELLLRHRALLFGLLGALLIAGALRSELRAAAIIAALVSMGGFLLLAAQSAELAAPLRRVALADLIATLLLLIALGLRAWVPTGGSS
ncbi:phosphopantetheine adenylyltransferase [Solimonas fluminis]|uniref:Phosphopantetheine adenylyltransferase n=1 Tax=Solimonas fluminis TaxID=2086571 RepID=A0A2S5TER0_9GAMM|nr:phosphopantetheine adenylyltransferase [Solimonas fluminis]PPE73422.1 phosphopantetheine adenylyltransferase [Solimonas fluminis]